jgi:ribosomal 50S subunit-recycling heat shock protein
MWKLSLKINKKLKYNKVHLKNNKVFIKNKKIYKKPSKKIKREDFLTIRFLRYQSIFTSKRELLSLLKSL